MESQAYSTRVYVPLELQLEYIFRITVGPFNFIRNRVKSDRRAAKVVGPRLREEGPLMIYKRHPLSISRLSWHLEWRERLSLLGAED